MPEEDIHSQIAKRRQALDEPPPVRRRLLLLVVSAGVLAMVVGILGSVLYLL